METDSSVGVQCRGRCGPCGRGSRLTQCRRVLALHPVVIQSSIYPDLGWCGLNMDVAPGGTLSYNSLTVTIPTRYRLSICLFFFHVRISRIVFGCYWVREGGSVEWFTLSMNTDRDRHASLCLEEFRCELGERKVRRHALGGCLMGTDLYC